MRCLCPIALILAACTAEPDLAPPPAPAPAAVHPSPVQPPLLGVVAARTSEIVAAQVDGRITKVIARSGQRVHAGDPIAEIDPTIIEQRVQAAAAAIDVARAELAGAQAEVAEARRQVGLENRMFAAGAAAEENVRVARANVTRAVAAEAKVLASLRQAEASHAAMQSELVRTHLIAPIDGVVSLVKAQPGEVVAPGVAIARVFDPVKLMIRFQVSPERRHEVAIGTTVELRVPSLQAPLTARVTAVSADLEPPLDFALAEADIVDSATADVQIGVLGDVRVAP